MDAKVTQKEDGRNYSFPRPSGQRKEVSRGLEMPGIHALFQTPEGFNSTSLPQTAVVHMA